MGPRFYGVGQDRRRRDHRRRRRADPGAPVDEIALVALHPWIRSISPISKMTDHQFRRPPAAQIVPVHRRAHRSRLRPDARPVPPSAPARISTHPSQSRRGKGSTGTAFSIRDDGIWFTARHVVDGCDRVGLQVDQRRAAKVQKVQSHPKADIAVLWTRGGKPARIASAPLRVNQPGYHVGYPEGKPGRSSAA